MAQGRRLWEDLLGRETLLLHPAGEQPPEGARWHLCRQGGRPVR